eukprot:1160569-Pelagomonas_calceolata.AAC.1
MYRGRARGWGVCIPTHRDPYPCLAHPSCTDERACTEAELQDGVRASPAAAHTTKRARKTHLQPPSSAPEGEEDGDAHLDRVFGEAPAAKPLNIADMLSPRELPPAAKEVGAIWRVVCVHVRACGVHSVQSVRACAGLPAGMGEMKLLVDECTALSTSPKGYTFTEEGPACCLLF